MTQAEARSLPDAGFRSRSERVGRGVSRLLTIDPTDWAGSLFEVVLRVLAAPGALVYVPAARMVQKPFSVQEPEKRVKRTLATVAT